MWRLLLSIIFPFALHAAETIKTYPLWDGRESIAEYAQKVDLPPTKTIELGHGIKLDFVLIPAGKFVMGSPLPEVPKLNVSAARVPIYIGSELLLLTLILSRIFRERGRKKLSYSLMGLFLFTTSCGLIVGGIARSRWAAKEEQRYNNEVDEYNAYRHDEQPAHTVTISQPFYMCKYPVTEEQFQEREQVLIADPKSIPIGVAWQRAYEFCGLFNAVTGEYFIAKLPTEAQWEYACRAGTNTLYYSGNSASDLNDVAWFAANSGGKPHPVGMKKPNAFGLYDMHGNVCEWCADFYKPYEESIECVDPFVDIGTEHVFRGGSWMGTAGQCRAANRNHEQYRQMSQPIGFRIILTLKPPERQ